MSRLISNPACPHRRWLRAVAILAICTLTGDATRGAEPDKPLAWTPEQMMKVKRIGSVQVSPDGKQAAYTVRQAVMEADTSEYLTHLSLASADGTQVLQLTQGDKSCDEPQWSPDGKWIAFVSSRGGKKNLWAIDRKSVV